MIRDAKQLAFMLRAMRNEHSRMSPEDYRKSIQLVGLYQEEAGVYFGYSPRVGRRWGSGEQVVPWPVQWALEFMTEHGLSAKEV
jgi:hypothetical protein